MSKRNNEFLEFSTTKRLNEGYQNINMESEEFKQEKLKLLIIKLLKDIVIGNPTSEFIKKQKTLEFIKGKNGIKYYEEISKLLKTPTPEIVMFCAIDLKNSKILSMDMANLVHKCLDKKLPDKINNILLDYFLKINNIKFFELIMKNVDKSQYIVHIIYRILKTDIKLNFNHLLEFQGYPKNKMTLKILKKVMSKMIQMNVEFINKFVANLFKNFKFEEIVTLLIVIFKKFENLIHIKVKEQCTKSLIQLPTKNIKSFILLYYTLRSFKLQDKKCAQFICDKFIKVGLKVNFDDKTLRIAPLEFLEKEKPHKDIKEDTLRQITKKIIPLLDKSLDYSFFFKSFITTNPISPNNAFIIEFLGPLCYLEPVKKFLLEVYRVHTMKIITSGTFLQKLCHIDMIFYLVKNKVEFNEGHFIKNLKFILNLKNPIHKVSTVHPVIKLNIIKLITIIFDKDNSLDYEEDFGTTVLFEVFLKNLFDHIISRKLIIYLYKFLRKYVSKYEDTQKNRVIDFISYNLRNINIDKYDPIFKYYLFEIIALLIRNIYPVFKSGVFILNNIIHKLCLNLLEFTSKSNDGNIKCFIYQILILVNFFHMLWYETNVLNFKKDNIEMAYLKDKYNYVRLFIDRDNAKYYKESDGSIATYATYDPPDKYIKELDIKNNTMYYLEDGKKCLFDSLLTTLKGLNINRPIVDHFMKTIIKNDLKNLVEHPTLAILISTYVILKEGKLENDLKKYLLEQLKNSIFYINGSREFNIIKIALGYLGFNLTRKPPFNYIHNKNYFAHMIFLKEARIYCIEHHNFKK